MVASNPDRASPSVLTYEGGGKSVRSARSSIPRRLSKRLAISYRAVALLKSVSASDYMVLSHSGWGVEAKGL